MKTSQTERLRLLLADGAPHSTVEIMERVYGGSHLGIARIGARVFDVKERTGWEIKSWKDDMNPTIWHYQATGIPKAPPRIVDWDTSSDVARPIYSV